MSSEIVLARVAYRSSCLIDDYREVNLLYCTLVNARLANSLALNSYAKNPFSLQLILLVLNFRVYIDNLGSPCDTMGRNGLE
jgi:hypothetical protein